MPRLIVPSNLERSARSASTFMRFEPRNQSCAHIKHWSVNGDKELLKSSRTRPLVLKADSEATVDMGIANISLAMHERIGKRGELHFHQERMSKPLTSSSVS